MVYEAEDAILSTTPLSKVMSNHHGAYNGEFVDMGGNGSWLEWSINVDSSGGGSLSRMCTLAFRYANGALNGNNRPCSVEIDGNEADAGLVFASTSSWSSWIYETIEVPCNAGVNTLRITATSSNGGERYTLH